MATVTTACDDSVWVLVSAADGVLQNVSTPPLQVCFNATLPAVDHTHFHILEKNQIMTRISGLPAGNIYIRVGANKNCRAAFSS